jgi:phosphoenolpyruvate carboxykinase (ATP)
VGSTEVGQSEPIKTTFSTCFGAAFFPRPAQVYAALLMRRLEQTGATVYLVNTGWTGGAYGKGGQRFSIPVTRAVIHGILHGGLDQAECEQMPGFNFAIPKQLAGVDSQLLNPRHTWKNPANYDAQATQLIDKFRDNFSQFDVAAIIKEAGPKSD